MEIPFTGGCLCGEIRYTVKSEPLGMGHCHCRDCQYVSSTSQTSVVLVHVDGLSWEQGKPKEFRNTGDSGNEVIRTFCPTCGTPLTGHSAIAPQFIGLKAATLDNTSSFKPTIEMYVASAPEWTVFSDSTAKFEKGMP